MSHQSTVTRRLLEERLGIDFQPNLRRGLPVVDFVKVVYGFSPDQIPSKVYTLDEHAYELFCEVNCEKSSYKPLQAIFTKLQEQLYGEDGAGRPLRSSFYALREKKVVSNHMAFKPDFLFSTNPLNNAWRRQDWSTTLSYGEVKRSRVLKNKYQDKSDNTIQLEKLLQVRLINRVCFSCSYRQSLLPSRSQLPMQALHHLL